MRRRRLAVLTVAIGTIVCLRAAPAADLDAAFARFWGAKDANAAGKAAGDIVKAGASFDRVYERLTQGRPYSRDVATGVVTGKRVGMAGEFGYSLDVPAAYDPGSRYQVRIQLHGGIGRDQSAARRAMGIGRLAGREQIYVLPLGWNDAPWWSDAQLENLRAILDTVKRTYNVDENRVVVTGVSDGGTGAYYVAMRDPTPYAAFLPLNGSIVVLRNPSIGVTGELYPTNLKNRPFFVVNGGRDPLYPTASVEPYLKHLDDGGVAIVYKPQPNAGHDTSWWPDVKDQFEAFAHDHPRTPLPDRLTWETADTRTWSRLHWLVVDALGSRPGEAQALPDLNDFGGPEHLDFGFRMDGARIERVLPGSNADRIGLRAGDVIVRIGQQPIATTADIVTAFQHLSIGGPAAFTVTRSNRQLDLAGTFAPMQTEPQATSIFTHRARSGRVDLVRTGNVIDAATRGVSEFTLLLSPDQFDFSRPLKVSTNGHVAYEGIIEKSTATLLKWAARDNDRTMLFGAEVKVRVK